MRLIPRWLQCLWWRFSSPAYPVFPPPTPEELLAHPNVHRERLFKRVHRIPKGESEDTPLFSLYRLYEHLVLNDNVGLRNEIDISGTRSGRLPPSLTPTTHPHLATRSFQPSQHCWLNHSTGGLSWVCRGKQTPLSHARNWNSTRRRTGSSSRSQSGRVKWPG